MTTKNRQTCLSAEMLRQLSHDELSPTELEAIEEHVSGCDRCRTLLEVGQSDPQWREEIVPILRTPLESPRAAGDHDDDGSGESQESILRMLAPTDDPHMLGRIGSYEVVGVIGRGGMGVVFKAYEAALNRFVAIKMLLPHLAASGAARKRFAREGQAAAAVIDDNVLPIYSVAEWQGVPYLVTQYSRGATLQKRIQDQGPLELKEILRIGMQTARGLAAAHAQGLVHRDVKPSNILLDGSVERALLTDFGLARAVDDASITRTGIISGTPQYMSPEQARGGSVDARSDLFGLGCVLYAMCTGRPPFRADSSYAILRMITDDEPRSIREVNPDIPEWLCLLISRLMAKSPDIRLGGALDVADLLEQCLAHVQQPTSVPLPASLVPRATGHRSVSNVTGKGLIAMIGAIGVTLLGMMLWQATSEPQSKLPNPALPVIERPKLPETGAERKLPPVDGPPVHPKLADDKYAKSGVPLVEQTWPMPPWGAEKGELSAGIRIIGNARSGGEVKAELWVRNSGAKDVAFSQCSRADIGLSVVAKDKDGKEHSADITQFRGRPIFSHWLLPPGHIVKVKEFTLKLGSKKNDERERSWASLDLPPGDYKLRAKWSDSHALVAHAGDWTGELTTGEVELKIAAADTGADATNGTKPLGTAKASGIESDSNPRAQRTKTVQPDDQPVWAVAWDLNYAILKQRHAEMRISSDGKMEALFPAGRLLRTQLSPAELSALVALVAKNPHVQSRPMSKATEYAQAVTRRPELDAKNKMNEFSEMVAVVHKGELLELDLDTPESTVVRSQLWKLVGLAAIGGSDKLPRLVHEANSRLKQKYPDVPQWIDQSDFRFATVDRPSGSLRSNTTVWFNFNVDPASKDGQVVLRTPPEGPSSLEQVGTPKGESPPDRAEQPTATAIPEQPKLRTAPGSADGELKAPPKPEPTELEKPKPARPIDLAATVDPEEPGEDLTSEQAVAARDPGATTEGAQNDDAVVPGWVIAWDFNYTLLRQRYAMMRISSDGKMAALFPGWQLLRTQLSPDALSALVALVAKNPKVQSRSITKVAEYSKAVTPRPELLDAIKKVNVRSEIVAVVYKGELLELNLDTRESAVVMEQLWKFVGLAAIGGAEKLPPLVEVANTELKRKYPDLTTKLDHTHFRFALVDHPSSNTSVWFNFNMDPGSEDGQVMLRIPQDGQPSIEKVVIPNAESTLEKAEKPNAAATPELPKLPD